MLTIKQLRSEVEQRKGKRDLINQNIANLEKKINDEQRSLNFHEQAREVIRKVAIETQSKLSYHISDITSLALEAVYENPYKVIIEFVQRRNKTECDILFERDGNRIDPMDAAGGGVVNVASFALRIASWSMGTPKTRNSIFIDEGFNNVATHLLPRVGEMLNQVAERLKLQIVLITHQEPLIELASRTFRVTINDGISKIVRL